MDRTESTGGEATTRAREAMVTHQIAGRGIDDPLVLKAMRLVPRERFVSEAMAPFAYDDAPLPIEAGQTISQPYIVARMIELAAIRPGDRVLEVGAGSGYAAAVMSRIAGHVFAIERHGVLADAARRRMMALGYDNVTVYEGDGSVGLSAEAPFDAIVVSAGGTSIPAALREQLAIGGRLVIPVGGRRSQVLKRVIRRGEDAYDVENHGAVVFVPLVT